MAYFKPLPPLERLNELFVLDESSPSGLSYKTNRSTKKAGDPAGTLTPNGYWQLSINKIGYRAHRIIYFMRTGINPGNQIVDHPNRDRSDNKQVLRLVDKSRNNMNADKREGTSSKYKGVCRISRRQESWVRWVAHITTDGETKYLGYFEDEKEAAQAYDRAAIELFGEYAKTNFQTKQV